MLRTLGLYDYYRRVVGLRSLVLLARARSSKRPYLLEMRRPDVAFPFSLRVPSFDVVVFEHIFLRQEYRFDVTTPPSTIVDAGANIGLSSIYFANRFPQARIVAIEPEERNFELLERNTRPYPNVVAVHGALWHEDTSIALVDPGAGEWGFMTETRGATGERAGEILQTVRGVTVDIVMREHGLEHIDIMKMDIEGAEREVFSDASSWLGKVDALIVELHERLKPGCNRSFYQGTRGFDDEWLDGENVYLTRRRGCVTRRSPRPDGPS
jgi:FkbM family methyltransferase